MKSEQTSAVEWLFQQLWNEPKDKLTWHSIFEKAKDIEKEQMFEYIKNNYVIGEYSSKFHQKEFEKYYNEKYGK